jgi:hypothetical protein
MTNALLLRASPRHRCATPFSTRFAVGTIWCCDHCQTVWVRQLIDDWAHTNWGTQPEWRRASRAERRECTH